MQIDYTDVRPGTPVWDIVRSSRMAGLNGPTAIIVTITLGGPQALWLAEMCFAVLDPAGTITEIAFFDQNPITLVTTEMFVLGAGGGGLYGHTVPFRFTYSKRESVPWNVGLRLAAAGAGIAAGSVLTTLLCLKQAGNSAP